MNPKHNKCASEASSSKLLCKEAAKGDQKGRFHHTSGGELVRNDVPLTCKEVLSPSSSHTASQQVSHDALLELAYLLKEIYLEAKPKGYRIINGKLTKVPVDSEKSKNRGTMLPLSDNQTSV